jgi:hypothetical protein
MDVGLQGSHCASDVVREDDKWVVRCGYGSENDMNKYAFVTNPPSEPADPVCDECVDQRLIMGDLVEITPECYRTARTLGDYSPRPPGTRGLVARIRHHMENEVAMRGLIDAAVRASEVGHPEFDDVGHLELDAAVSEYRRYQRWIGELDDGGETYAEGAPEVATQMREVARQLEQLAVFWERKGARPTAGSPTPVSPPPGS